MKRHSSNQHQHAWERGTSSGIFMPLHLVVDIVNASPHSGVHVQQNIAPNDGHARARR
jgi:hypothetical protein